MGNPIFFTILSKNLNETSTYMSLLLGFLSLTRLFQDFHPGLLNFPKKTFFTKNLLLHCTYDTYQLVTPPIILTFWLDGPTVKEEIKKTKVFFSFTVPFHNKKIVKSLFFAISQLEYFDYCPYLYPWTQTNLFLIQKTHSITFLKFECCILSSYRFLYSKY